MTGVLIAALILAAVVGLLLVFRKPIRQSWQAAELARAEKTFPALQEQLRRQFFELASRSGKPRGLIWVSCEWLNDWVIIREPGTQLITAFDTVNLSFEAQAGGEMEEVEAVSTVRDAAAVYHYRNGQWGTGGRALFNMNAQSARDWFLAEIPNPLKML